MQTPLWQLRQNSPYWASPAGLAQLAWEQQVFNAFAERVFGFYAVSFALGGLAPTAQSTIGHVIHVGHASGLRAQAAKLHSMGSVDGKHLALEMDLHDWPMQNDSLDYIVLPHVLEFSADPHAVLREAARCLRPGGSLAISAFNPQSVLGFQAGHTELGQRSAWLTRKRLIDWLQLLDLHTDKGAFGQWRPIHGQAQAFERWAWLDGVGERFWPQLANVFALRVVKRITPDLRQFQPKKRSIFARAPVVAGSNTQNNTNNSSAQRFS